MANAGMRLMNNRMGEIASDEMEMERCWRDIWEVLKKEGQVKDGDGW